MNDRLGAVTVLDAGILGIWALWSGVRARPLSSVQLAGLALLQVLLGLQATIDVAQLAGGRRPPEMLTHVGYLVVSVTVLPAAVASGFRRAARGADAAAALVRGDALMVVFGCAAAAVIVVRMFATGVTSGA
jgi:hypothetical protein